MPKQYLSVAFAYVGVVIGAGLASGQDRVVDQGEDDEGIQKRKGRVNAAGDLQSRNSHVPDAIHIQEKRHGVGCDNEGDQRTTKSTGLARNINA